MSPAAIMFKKLLSNHHHGDWMLYAILLTYAIIIFFFPEMTKIGFVFDVEEVMKVLEDAKTEISSNTNVIMTR
jgi:hypothetical protein